MKRIFIMLLFIVIGTLHADSTTVKNNSSGKITVMFQAWGCFNDYPVQQFAYKEVYTSRVCHRISIEPGKEATYNWKWGQSGKKVWAYSGTNVFKKTNLRGAEESKADAKPILVFPEDFTDVQNLNAAVDGLH